MKHRPIRGRVALWTAVFLTIELFIFGIASGWIIYKDQLEAFVAIRNQPDSPTVVRKETRSRTSKRQIRQDGSLFARDTVRP